MHVTYTRLCPIPTLTTTQHPTRHPSLKFDRQRRVDKRTCAHVVNYILIIILNIIHNIPAKHIPIYTQKIHHADKFW